jgi:hypothetical protein
MSRPILTRSTRSCTLATSPAPGATCTTRPRCCCRSMGSYVDFSVFYIATTLFFFVIRMRGEQGFRMVLKFSSSEVYCARHIHFCDNLIFLKKKKDVCKKKKKKKKIFYMGLKKLKKPPQNAQKKTKKKKKKKNVCMPLKNPQTLKKKKHQNYLRKHFKTTNNPVDILINPLIYL